MRDRGMQLSFELQVAAQLIDAEGYSEVHWGDWARQPKKNFRYDVLNSEG